MLAGLQVRTLFSSLFGHSLIISLTVSSLLLFRKHKRALLYVTETLFWMYVCLVGVSLYMDISQYQQFKSDIYPVGNWVLDAAFIMSPSLITLFWMNLPYFTTFSVTFMAFATTFVVVPLASNAWGTYSSQKIDVMIQSSLFWSDFCGGAPGKSNHSGMSPSHDYDSDFCPLLD